MKTRSGICTSMDKQAEGVPIEKDVVADGGAQLSQESFDMMEEFRASMAAGAAAAEKKGGDDNAVD